MFVGRRLSESSGSRHSQQPLAYGIAELAAHLIAADSDSDVPAVVEIASSHFQVMARVAVDSDKAVLAAKV